MPFSQLLAVVVAVAGVAAALWLLITGVRGASRVLGILGSILIVLGVLGRLGYAWLVERYLGRVEDVTIVTALAVETAVAAVLTAVGILLVSRAIVVAGWPSKNRSRVGRTRV